MPTRINIIVPRQQNDDVDDLLAAAKVVIAIDEMPGFEAGETIMEEDVCVSTVTVDI